MKKILFILCFFSTLCLADTNNNNTLILGQYPYLSPDMMLYRMEPIADYYQRKTGHTVLIKNAPSYEEFLARAQRGEYDIAYAPAHFAALLCSDYNYLPQMLFDVGYSALIVTMEKSTIKNPKDLVGKDIAIPQDLVVRTTLDQLAKLDIEEKDLSLFKKSTHDRALHSLFTGGVDAAIISTSLTVSLPIDTLEKLHVVEVYGDMKGDVLIMNKKTVDLISADLINNSAIDFESSPESKILKKRWKFNLQLRPISNAELSPLKKLAIE